MATGLKAKLDYDDYCAIPSDGKRYELINGQVHVTPAPSPLHQRASKRLQRLLEAYFEAPGRGEVFNAPIDVILPPHDVVQPDLVVVTDPSQVSRRGIEGAPLLVIEVLSPTTTVYDRTTKSQRYAALGIPHYWIVDPEAQTIECYHREGSTYRPITSAGPQGVFAHPDFPGFTFQLAQLWP
jgi:Uma2 family endonuclease